MATGDINMLEKNSLVKCTIFAICLWSFSDHTDGFNSYNGTETKYIDSNNVSHNEYDKQMAEQKSERVKYLENVNKYVWLIFAPVLLFVGLLGNTLSILVLRR